MARRFGEEDDGDDTSTIIDSGADVALFAIEMADKCSGRMRLIGATCLQDAQGNLIPTGGKKSVEIELQDVAGGDEIRERIWSGSLPKKLLQPPSTASVRTPQANGVSLTTLPKTLQQVPMRL